MPHALRTGDLVQTTVQLVIRQPGQPERFVRLTDGVHRLGRAEDNEVVLSDIGVSRRHARIVVAGGDVRVDDLGSGNGTFYRGMRVESQALEDGDELVVDPFVLQLRIRTGEIPVESDEVTQLGVPALARVEIRAPEIEGAQTVPMGPTGLTIGRSETRDVVLRDPASSRHHCSIVSRDGTWLLQDAGSANGVFLNGIRVREAPLVHGDRVRIGNTDIRFLTADGGPLDTSERYPSGEALPDTEDVLGEQSVELSLPPPSVVPAPPPPKPRPRPRAASSGGGGRLAAAAAMGVVLVAVLSVTLLASTLLVWLVWAETRPLQAHMGQEPRPPAWAVNLPRGLPPAAVEDLDRLAANALKASEPGVALEHLYRSLSTTPGRATTERLAVHAGERTILDFLQPAVERAGAEYAKKATTRDRLLADLERGGVRGARAEKELASHWRDDPEVRQRLRLDPSKDVAEQSKRLGEAAELANRGDWVGAARIYRTVRDTAADSFIRANADAGLTAATHRLVRATSEPWRELMLLDAERDTSAVVAQLDALAATWPDSPTLAAMRARYGLTSPR
jgi:pSer/pThr/pTyr-binding forkhead associated (FHA) protein